MARHFDSETLVLASHNPGKVREFASLLAPYGAKVISAADLGLDEPVEDGETFAANATLKAVAAAKASGHPALADDSGLVVHALDGRPGIHSARWAGPGKDFRMAMLKIEGQLVTEPNRAAHFICVLALAWPDGHVECFTGRADGFLIWPPAGNKGFGYDPMFRPNGHDLTYAQMEPADKHAISHRAKAFAKLVEGCFAK